MKLKNLKFVPLSLCAGALALGCLAQALLGHFKGLQLFQRLEWIAYDWRLRVANDFNPPVSDKLGFVFIGDDSIAIFSSGQLGTNFQFGLKWPRHIYGRVVRELKAQGAKGIGLDFLLGDHRPDHPPAFTPQGPMDSDSFLTNEVQRAGNVVFGATREVLPDRFFKVKPENWGDVSHERDSDGVLRRDRVFDDYRVWHRLIEEEAMLGGLDLGNAIVQTNQILFHRKQRTAAGSVEERVCLIISLNPDGLFDPTELTHARPTGGFVRLEKPFQEFRVWHLGIILAARELGLDLQNPIVELDKGRITLHGSNGARRVIPVDARGEFLIDWTLRPTDPRLTTEAFESVVSKGIQRENGSNIVERFKDKLVMVGSVATGNDMTDRGATPLDKEGFLTSNYWNVMNSVLTGRFIEQTSAWTDFLLLLLLGCAAAVLTWKLRAVWSSLWVALLVTGWVASSLFMFVHFRVWAPMVMPANAALLAHFSLVTYQTFFEQNERRRIKNLFAKLVSPNVVNELLGAKKLSLIGARSQVSVFFADIRGFTELTDRSHAQAEEYVRARKLGRAEAKMYFDQQAQVLLHTVNTYLSLIADVIKKHNGTLDKYIGDCVMAFWGAPAATEHHALACVRAAIDAQRAIEALNQERAASNQTREVENRARRAAGLPPLPMLDLLSLGTGINTGVVTVGLMGSDAHIFNYTVFGRDVNLASRLEGYSGRDRIVISEATYLELLRDDPALANACVALPPTKLKGFETAVNIFEVPWKDGVEHADLAVPEEREETFPAMRDA